MNRPMMIVAAGLVGVLFGLGLIVAGMANPAKVLAFLDVAGAWDPSLALVMGGAIGVALPAFALSRRRERGWLGARFDWPRATQIDRRLLLGGALFGVGWGMAGVCPGPALTWLFLLTLAARIATSRPAIASSWLLPCCTIERAIWC